MVVDLQKWKECKKALDRNELPTTRELFEQIQKVNKQKQQRIEEERKQANKNLIGRSRLR